ncbi:unnamed protein product [Symbiodinium sp. CCMP2592]|nr:unnamed protein product [Symbiodinium sp. CCMP2592]
MAAAQLPSDLAAACHTSALLLAQHGQALQQVLASLQAVLAQAAKAAEVPKDSDCGLTSSGKLEKRADEVEVVEPSHGGDTGKSKQTRKPGETTLPAATPTASPQNGCDGCVACTPCAPQPQQAQQPQVCSGCPSCPQKAKGCGKGRGWEPWPKFYDPEPRFDGWTSLEWKDWVSSSCGSRWCYNKKAEADMLAEWMVETWGLSNLQRGSGDAQLPECHQGNSGKPCRPSQPSRASLRHLAVLSCASLARPSRARAERPKGQKNKAKVALITGASTGIGRATAQELCRSSSYSTVFLAGHNESKTKATIDEIGSPSKLEYLPLELSSFQSVRQAAKQFQDTGLPLHTLVCNAAVMALPQRHVSVDGNELQLEVNYLSHFLLVNLLIPELSKAGTDDDPARTDELEHEGIMCRCIPNLLCVPVDTRIINVSSSAHFVRSPLAFGDMADLNLSARDGDRYAYYPWTAYGQSKLAQVMFTYELAKRLRAQRLPIVANALDPGIVDTELQRYLPTKAPAALMKLAKTPERGAETSVLLATAEAGLSSGGYWVDGQLSESLGRGKSPMPMNSELAVEGTTSYDEGAWRALWRCSSELVLDIGGEPGFLAASLLDRGIAVTVVDGHWGKTGKSSSHTQLQQAKVDGPSPQLRAICTTFDADFVEDHKELVENASAIVSLYGDEATTPCLQYAAIAKTPCVVIPCNECVRFYPPHQRNYEGYCQALLSFANDQGGRFQRAALEGAPFSRMLLVQLPDSDEFRQTREKLESHWQQTQQQWQQQWQQQQWQQQQWQQQQWQQQQWQQQQWQRQQLQQGNQPLCQQQQCHHQHNNTPM